MRKNISVVILAAGLGTRMKSDKAKVLHEVAERPMILYVVEVAQKAAGDDIIVVVGHQAQKVREIISEIAQLHFAYQEKQLGTAHEYPIALRVRDDRSYPRQRKVEQEAIHGGRQVAARRLEEQIPSPVDRWDQALLNIINQVRMHVTVGAEHQIEVLDQALLAEGAQFGSRFLDGFDARGREEAPEEMWSCHDARDAVRRRHPTHLDRREPVAGAVVEAGEHMTM